jgi:hypothetical protein
VRNINNLKKDQLFYNVMHILFSDLFTSHSKYQFAGSKIGGKWLGDHHAWLASECVWYHDPLNRVYSLTSLICIHTSVLDETLSWQNVLYELYWDCK